MIIGMTSIVVSLIYFIIVAIIYFKKDRTKNFDNKMYSLLVIFNIIGLFLELGCYYYVSHRESYLMINEVVNRLFLTYIVVWSFTLIIYEFKVIYENNKRITNFLNNHKKLFNVGFIILLILTLALVLTSDLQYFYDGKFVYSYGDATNVVFFPCMVSFLIGGISTFINRKNINMKKLIPFFVLFLILGIALVIRFVNPGYLYITPMLTLVTFIMYFTIENPDVKMINQLEYAKNTAEKANRAKTDFLSSMSHEIRTPLNAVVGFSECIKTATSLEEAQENAEDIIMASQNLLEIVNGILDISKIEADKMEIISTEYSPNKVFNDLTKMVETRIGEKEIELRTDFATDIPEVLYGDRGKVQQIITNILTNAVKYTEKGHIDFKVSCVNNNDDCSLCIVVKDSGRGIKPEKIKTLFNKFERLEEDKNTTIEGTGLGLAITKSLAEMMGGKVVVQSDYGVGSTFTVYIPQKIVHNSIFKPAEEIEETITTYSNSKVLVVDDNSLNLKVANKVLSNFDLEVELIDNGFECINKIENKEHYDIIFMDIMMPKMGGLETLKRLKQLENFNIPVIALTADAMEGKSNKYIEAGFNGYLSKPINKDELKKILDKHLSGKKVKQVEEEITQIKKDSICSRKALLIDTYEQTNEVVNFSKKIDIEVDSVENYEEFMDMYKKYKYDIIFVDCTDAEKYPKNLIEELKKDKNFNIPVIALNDDKIMGLREYYRNLGYDGYLAHPISELVFKKIVLKLLKNKQPEEDVLSKKGNIEYLKTNGIDVDASIELLGDIEMYNETLRIFMEENKTRIPNLKQYKESGDMENYAIQVHALKSDSKYLGFKELAEYSHQHEMKSKEGNKDYVNDHFDELMSEYNRIYGIIKEY